MATSGGGLTVFDQYSNAKPLLRGFPSWITGQDRDRIAAYSLYEQIYWTIPEAFKLLTRGSDEDPIYIPSGRQIVETIHRFTAPNLKIVTDPDYGTDAEKQNADLAITALFRRERFYSRFNTAKREGLIHGDWLFHIYADPARPEGSRISIFAVDPASYFPIHNDQNVDEIIGAHLAEYVLDEQGNPFIYRLTYRKTTGKGGPSPITVEEGLFKVDDWGGPDMKEANPEVVIRPPTALPDIITALPLYHIQNFQQTGTVWGSSEMRGIERIMAAVNQGVSDEELSLAMDGLGVYATDAGTPVDEDTGEPTSWNLGPARVVELPDGKKLWRVSGTTSVTPFQDHLKYLHQQLDATAATPAVAKGSVDVDVAESGVALMLELGPLLARATEKELIITDVLTNMLYDLKAWFQAYEGLGIGEAIWVPSYGDKIPVNHKQRFDEVMQMATATPQIVSTSWARSELSKIGYDFPEDTEMIKQILEEKTMVGAVEADVAGARMDQELANQPEAPPQPQPAGGDVSGG